MWRCFKTGRKGNFTSLYAHAENIPYFKAERNIILRNFEFQGEEIPKTLRPVKEQVELDTSNLEPITISSVDSDNPNLVKAWNFLFSRRLFNEVEEEEDAFFLCSEGRFANRIIIPFKNKEVVFFFQGRTLGDAVPKYLNPSVDIAPRASDLLYPYDENKDHLVVCEGPLDARSLQLQGVNATATIGSCVSPRQAEILSTFKGDIIMGYDNDEAGYKGLVRFDNLRKDMMMENFYICSPPQKYKDWNEAHVAEVPLSDWIQKNQKKFDFEYQAINQLFQE